MHTIQTFSFFLDYGACQSAILLVLYNRKSRKIIPFFFINPLSRLDWCFRWLQFIGCFSFSLLFPSQKEKSLRVCKFSDICIYTCACSITSRHQLFEPVILVLCRQYNVYDRAYVSRFIKVIWYIKPLDLAECKMIFNCLHRCFNNKSSEDSNFAIWSTLISAVALQSNYNSRKETFRVRDKIKDILVMLQNSGSF